MKYVSQSARFSPCGRYRYNLLRNWDGKKGHVLFIGLNPSTADHKTDDPTIRRCVGFAKLWGYGSMEIVNLFAYKATYPKDLFAADNPIGPRNNYWINKAYTRSDNTIACWGSLGNYQQRAANVMKRLGKLQCLQINKGNEPAHPLYLRANLKPFPYVPQAR